MRKNFSLILCISFPYFTIAQSDFTVAQKESTVHFKDSTILEKPEEGNMRVDLSDDLSDNRIMVAYFFGTTGGLIIGWHIRLKIVGKKKVDRFPLGIAIGLLVAAVPVLEGDNLSLSVRTVYGDYKMGQMKKTLTQSLPQIKDMNVPYSVTDNFPAYIGYEVSFSGVINKWSIGTKLGFRTTGGRFGYRDKTEEIYFENLLKLLEITEFVKYSIIKTNKLNLMLGLNAGAGRVMERRERKIALSDGHLENYVDKSTSLNIILGTELMCNLSLTKHLKIEVFGGYDSHIFTGLNTGINNLPEKAGNTDWTGIRVGLGLGWIFNQN